MPGDGRRVAPMGPSGAHLLVAVVILVAYASTARAQCVPGTWIASIAIGWLQRVEALWGSE
jgi:hypothetical protein